MAGATSTTLAYSGECWRFCSTWLRSVGTLSVHAGDLDIDSGNKVPYLFAYALQLRVTRPKHLPP